MHLRMFEMAFDHATAQGFEIIGGYLSPVGDAYKKSGLASSNHRIRMCEMAANQTSNWIMVDPWEALKSDYTPTAMVLDHFDEEINGKLGGVETENGEKRKVRIALLAGSDLISTMAEPGVWGQEDLDHILGDYGAFIIERSGSKADKAVEFIPQKYHRNIHIIRQLIANDVSSTKIRDLLSQIMSVHYLLPACVIEYIQQNGLYRHDNSSRPTSTPPPPAGSAEGGDGAGGSGKKGEKATKQKEHALNNHVESTMVNGA